MLEIALIFVGIAVVSKFVIWAFGRPHIPGGAWMGFKQCPIDTMIKIAALEFSGMEIDLVFGVDYAQQNQELEFTKAKK